jgi:hypothetical protein
MHEQLWAGADLKPSTATTARLENPTIASFPIGSDRHLEIDLPSDACRQSQEATASTAASHVQLSLIGRKIGSATD